MATPLNAKQIAALAENYELPPNATVRLLCRTAENLHRQAQAYEDQGDLQNAYLLWFRQAKIVLDLHARPDAGRKQDLPLLVALMKQVPENLAHLEVIKPKIDERFKRWTEQQRERAAQAKQASQVQQPSPQPSDRSWFEDESKTLNPTENREIAAQLAEAELRRRRQQSRRLSRPMHIPLEEDDHRRRMLETRRRIDDSMNPRRSKPRYETSTPSEPIRSPRAAYPSVPQPSLFESRDRFDGGYERPSLPPKEAINTYTQASSSPERRSIAGSHSSSGSGMAKPGQYKFKTVAALESGVPLRTIFLPSSLRSDFLNIARPSTNQNLETCGILCGSLISNALFISKLIIPEQIQTTDTCETVNEEALFDYCEKEDLMVLGWIHTHPTQSCFMSSRDMHTHAGYQIMLPESIAIVCAPSQNPRYAEDKAHLTNSWGIFRLSDPPGMQTIMKCNIQGVFHPHPGNNIYVDALRPGHVCEIDGIKFDIHDLRPR